MAYGPGQAYSPQPARPGPTQLGPAGAGPMVNPSWLAATADRERTVGTLRAGFAEGRLSQDELDERIAQAYAARTYADLWALTADLPIGRMWSGGGCGPFMPYSSRFSMKTTGFGSWIAARSSP